jgi:site-specific recombinase XerD
VGHLSCFCPSVHAWVVEFGRAATLHVQDWLGHRSIQYTTRYTQLSAAPFKDFWR